MNEPVPLTGKALRSFERDLTLWALKLLWRGMMSEPRSAVAKFRAALALRKVAATYMGGLKPVRLGQSVKMGLYIPHWPGQALDTRVRRAINSNGVHYHEQVMLSVTDACPYKCPHCFNYRKAQPPMPIDRLRELVGEIQDVGGSWVCIHGGEPLVDIDRTMAVVEAADDRSEVWLATTGFDLDANTARRLKRAGLYGAMVSLHHHDPAGHDSFVGYPGAYKIAVDAIEHFRRAGVFVAMNAALTPERINQQEILRLMDLAKDLGAGMVDVLFIRPGGRAVVGCDRLLPEAEDLRVLEQAMALFNKHAEFGDYPVLVSPAYYETPDRFGCVAGNERIFISAAGDLQPCAMVNLSVGNVVKEGFAEVASRLRSLLPCPRRRLVCTQLQPIVRERLRSGAGVELPLEPSVSLGILRDLPSSDPPGAYQR